LTPPDELRHLAEGPRDGESPGGVGVVEVNVRASGAAADVLRRSREVLHAVLIGAEPAWPSVEVWSRRLPLWFVEGCAAEQSAEDREQWLDWWRGLDPAARASAAEERPWSFRDWLSWLQPGERQWFWWDGRVVGPDEARILVEVPSWPTALGALTWLLRVAGAEITTVASDSVR